MCSLVSVVFAIEKVDHDDPMNNNNVAPILLHTSAASRANCTGSTMSNITKSKEYLERGLLLHDKL